MTPFVEAMSPPPDPVRCCEALEGLPYRLFLDSASTASRFGRYSFLTADPVAVVRSRGVEVECLDVRTGARREISGDPLVAFLDLIRMPILYNQVPSLATYGTAILSVMVLCSAASLMLVRQQKRLIFYL